ncbi:hypothetical protein FKN01_30920, partial [Streptomyces sp. 130]
MDTCGSSARGTGGSLEGRPAIHPAPPAFEARGPGQSPGFGKGRGGPPPANRPPPPPPPPPPPTRWRVARAPRPPPPPIEKTPPPRA